MKLRFAPSPTGYLHVGNVRTALVNWLFARHLGGSFLLRLDDTDAERSKPEFEAAIREDLQWLGLDWDDEVRQMDRMASYEAAKQALIAKGRLYPCYETKDELETKRKFQLSRGLPPLYDRAALALSDAERQELEAGGRKPHWRFKLEDAPIQWVDLVRGPVQFEGRSMSDPILFREDGVPTYMLPSVVDDLELGITHIVRGEDHVSNTAIQIQMMQALDAEAVIPQFAHLALMKTKDGELSKRKGGGDIRSLREQGIEPLAIAAYLARIGTSEAVEAVASLDVLVQQFDISKFGRAPATYDPEVLSKLSGKMLGMLDFAAVQQRLCAIGLERVDAVFWESVKHNIGTLEELKDWWVICREELEPGVAEEDCAFLKEAAALLPDEPWDEGTWAQWTGAVKEATGRKGKELFLPLRMALTGREHGPELKALLPVMGRGRVLERLLNL